LWSKVDEHISHFTRKPIMNKEQDFSSLQWLYKA